MFRKFIKKFKTKWRKHAFDLDHPQTAVYGGVVLDGVPFHHPIFACKACGKTLGLDLWQMLALPPEMARGCPGHQQDG